MHLLTGVRRILLGVEDESQAQILGGGRWLTD